MIQTLELVHVVFECIRVQAIVLMISEAMGDVIEHKYVNLRMLRREQE